MPAQSTAESKIGTGIVRTLPRLRLTLAFLGEHHGPGLADRVRYAKTAPMRTSRSLPPRRCQIWHED